MHKLGFEVIPANDERALAQNNRLLGKALEDAFHHKADTQKLLELVNKGAPVNYRLNYGLPLHLESEYVAALFYLLEGHKDDQTFKKNIQLACSQGICGANNLKELYGYTRTAVEFYNILSVPTANRENIPLNPEFVKNVKENAISGRADPIQTNGSLIVAAGLQDAALVNEIATISKQHPNVPDQENGAHINFFGFFGCHGPIHSAILLDLPSLQAMFNYGPLLGCNGIAKASLLHWVAVSARLDNSPERQSKAIAIAEYLLASGETLECQNLFGTSVLDCATGKLKEHLMQYKIDPLLKVSL